MVAAGTQIIVPKSRPKEDRGFWETLERNIRLGVGKEKVLLQQQMAENARLERMIGRKVVNGLGQLTAVIPARLYFRWNDYQPGIWNDRKEANKIIRDTPEIQAARPDKKYY